MKWLLKISTMAQVLIVSLLVLGADLLLSSGADASMLVALLFWAGVGQGIIALSAAADVAKGKWHLSIRSYLHQYYSLLLLFPLLFLVYARHIAAYQWSGNPNAWLNTNFFIIRNLIALLLPLVLAHFYVEAARKESPQSSQPGQSQQSLQSRTGLFSVLYLVSFVISQCFMAYDLVMTFEYPFVNTLFGPYFFVESLYAGIAFSVVLSGFLVRKVSDGFKSVFNDFTVMMMGFSLLWAGLFYSQYLVIWYGNIPEEVAYIYKRVSIPLVDKMGIYMLFALFLSPFLFLVSRKVKANIVFVRIIAFILFSGLIVERLIFLIPVVSLNAGGVIVPLVLTGLPFFALIVQQTRKEKA